MVLEQLKKPSKRCERCVRIHKDVRYVYTVDPDIDVDTVEQVTPMKNLIMYTFGNVQTAKDCDWTWIETSIY